MNLAGARIYNEGVEINSDAQEKILKIVNTIKTAPSSEVSMRFLKSGAVVEGLLWGKADGVPIGVYNRGPSMSHVLDTLTKRVKRECLKVTRLPQRKPREKQLVAGQPDLAFAS